MSFIVCNFENPFSYVGCTNKARHRHSNTGTRSRTFGRGGKVAKMYQAQFGKRSGPPEKKQQFVWFFGEKWEFSEYQHFKKEENRFEPWFAFLSMPLSTSSISNLVSSHSQQQSFSGMKLFIFILCQNKSKARRKRVDGSVGVLAWEYFHIWNQNDQLVGKEREAGDRQARASW